MPFQWSENAAHIQSLYHPWNSNDGYSDAAISAAEQTLNVQFPILLRHFYRSWGKRDDLTRFNQRLLRPDDVFLKEDALIFCVENQGVWYWAIPCPVVDQDDPPVYMVRNEDPPLVWLPSHAHLSQFLDYLTYAHAFDGGAIHGGWSKEWINDEIRMQLRHYGHERILPTDPPWLVPDESAHPWSLIIGEQYALDGLLKIAVATSWSDVLDHISAGLQITWEHHW